MKVNAQITKKQDAKATLSVEVDDESVSKEFEKVIRYLQKESRINGFRPGKAPVSVIKTKFKAQIKNTVRDNLLPYAVEEALKVTDIKPYTTPRINIIELEEGKPFKFEMEVELPPEVSLCQYTDLTFFKDEYKISKKDVERELKKLQEHYADYVPKKNNIIEENDVVTVKIEAYFNDKLLKEYTNENYRTEMNKERIREELYNALINSRKGEEKEVEIEYPENFSDRILAGKKIKYKIFIKEIRQKQLPALDDEFAKDVGEYNSLKELKESLEKQLEEFSQAKAEEKLENDIIEKIIRDSKFKIPDSMIEAHTNYLAEELTRNMASRGYNLNELVQNKIIDIKKLRDQLQENAIKDLKVYLALKNIREKEGIEVTQEEIDNEIKNYAKRYNQNFEEYKSRLPQSTIETLKQQIGNIKVLNFLKEKNRIKKGKKHKFEDLTKTETEGAQI